MGRAQLVTMRPVAALGFVRSELDRGTLSGDVTPLFASRLIAGLTHLFDEITFVHNRAAVATLALHDVDDARNIAHKCRLAYLSPETFDLGPLEPDEAA